MASFNTTSYDRTSVAYNMMSPIFIDGSNSIPMSGSQYYNGVFGNIMAGFCVDGLDSILGGNVIITGDVSCCSRLLVNGNVSIGGNTAFTTYLPTSSLVPSTAYQLTNKTYVDTQVATKTTLAGVQSNNNVFTGTMAVAGDANFTSSIGLRTDGVQSIYMTDTVGQYTTSNLSYCRMFAAGPNAYVDFYGTRIWRNTLATGIVSGGQVMKLGSTGNLQISGGLTTGGATQMNGNLTVTGAVDVIGTTNFDAALPTSIITAAFPYQLTNKYYVDTKASLANNNTFAGTMSVTGTLTANGILNATNGLNVTSTLKLNNTANIKGMACGTTVGSTNGTVTVNFGFTFASVPVVTATPNYAGVGYILSCMVISVNTTSFQYNILSGTTPAHFEQFSGVNWIAIGT